MALGTTAQRARDLLISVKSAASVLTAVAGLRARNIKFNAEVVDVTNADSANMFRELLANTGVKSFSVTGSGVANNFASYEVLRDAFFTQSLRDGTLVIPGLGPAACKVLVSALEFSGDYNNQLSFSMTLESSGDITWTTA